MEHRRFTASTTGYLYNLTDKERAKPFYAVHFQEAPSTSDEGAKSIAWKFPALIVSDMVDDTESVANRVAELLEKHWDDEVAK